MTIVECRRCRSNIMSWAASCPACGDDRVRRFQMHRLAGWAAVILAVASFGAALPWL